MGDKHDIDSRGKVSPTAPDYAGVHLVPTKGPLRGFSRTLSQSLSLFNKCRLQFYVMAEGASVVPPRQKSFMGLL